MKSTGSTRVILLGPAAPVQGGMAAVVDALHGSSLGTHFELAVLNTGKPTPEDRPWYIAVSSQLRLFRTLAAMLAGGHGHLVHIHTCSGLVFWRDSLFLLLARLFRRKALWHVHGGGFEEFIEGMGLFRRALLALAFSMSSSVIVLSESWRSRLSRRLIVRRWAVVENGVTLPPLTQRAADEDTLLFVGTLDNVKGVKDLIAATVMASRDGFGGRVAIAGRETSPGQRDRLQSLIEREGLVERIQLLGLLSGQQKVDAFVTAGVFVLPSYVEGLPMALLEAMSYSLPVIATDVGSIPEVVTDGVEGFLVRPGDVEALADRMTQLWSDTALRDKMGAAGRRRVEECHTVEAMASKVAEIYRTTRQIR